MNKYSKYFVITIILFLSIFCFSIVAKSYQAYSVGEEVEYKGIGYYVLKNSDEFSDTVTLLKKRLLVEKEVRDYCNNLSIEVSKPYAGVSYGTTTDYSTSNVKKIVEAWAKDKFSNELKEDDTGYSARVMTYDEYTDNCDYIRPNPTSSYIYVPKFDFMKGLHTWTMTPYQDSNDLVWYLRSSADATNISFNSGTIRPVINIKKEFLKDKEPKEYSLSDKRNFIVGDVIVYNNMRFYVIKNSDENSNTVTAIKDKLLSKDELKHYMSIVLDKYGKDLKNSVDLESLYTKYYENDNCIVDYNGSDTIGIYDDCTNDYTISIPKMLVEAWANDKLDSNDLAKDETGYAVRLIQASELLDNYNYEIYDYNIYIYDENIPSFFFDDKGYWTMTPASVDGMKVESTTGETGILAWAVSGNGFIEKAEIVRKLYGIRPVVTFKKINSSDETTNIVKVDDTFLKPVIWIVILGIIIIVGIIISTILFIKFNKNNQE